MRGLDPPDPPWAPARVAWMQRNWYPARQVSQVPPELKNVPTTKSPVL